MISSLASSGAGSSSYLSKLFSRLDTNNDGSVSKSEFTSGAPSGVSSDKASKLFDELDSDSNGTLSQSDLQTVFQQMASGMQSALLQAQEQSSGTDPDGDGDQSAGQVQGGGHHGHGHHAAEMFSKLDSNGDGSLTKDEFLAGKPSDVSSDQASALWDKVSGGADSVSESQFAEGMKQAGPPPGPPPSDSASDSSSSSSSDANGKLVDQLLAALEKDSSSSSSSDSSSSTGNANVAQLLEQYLKAAGMYQNAANQSSASAAAVTSVAA